MLLPWVRVLLGRKHLQRADETNAGFRRLDHIVDIAALGCDERICESFAIFVGQLFFALGGIACFGDFFFEVGSSRVDLQACKLEYSIVSPK